MYVSGPWRRCRDRPQGEVINAYAGADGPGIYGPPSSTVPAPSFGVNPADLDAAATVAHTAGQAIPEELKHVYQPSDNAVAGLLGWQTAGSLHSCTDAWEECLRKLGSEVDGISTKFSQTATNYRNVDKNGANGIGGVGSGRYSLEGN
ncbi:WXG100 family type VII secretion target [Kitasatospora sp. NPDC089509]|uniref:WXG100 family type VII secretion target n=1 Tax=Kitasatospora sp. NPDC089509 TaxID=3364079 RepID=UPI003803D352